MTIPTDGRIDLDALAELAGPLRALSHLGSIEDGAIIAQVGEALPALIDLARRAAIPSEQGEAVAWDCADDAGIFCTTHVKTAAENIAAKGYTVTPLYHHPAPAAGVKVKALEWEEVSSKILDARDGIGGLYRLRKNEDGSWTAIKYGDPFRADRETLDDAKAAAQADYEARILSALDQGEPK